MVQLTAQKDSSPKITKCVLCIERDVKLCSLITHTHDSSLGKFVHVHRHSACRQQAASETKVDLSVMNEH